MNPAAVFRSTADYTRSHRVEVPTYATLAGVITQAFSQLEAQTTEQLRQFLTPTMQERLNTLGEWEDEGLDQDSSNTTGWRYRVTRFMRPQEVMKPSAIQENVQDYIWLKQTYHLLQPMLDVLALSDEMIQYYAGFVLWARHHQIFPADESKALAG